MPILTKSGRIAIAESLAARPLHVAWGLGNGSWTTPPDEDVEATALINEIGRRVATAIGFVTPDVGGSIVLPTGTFAPSVSPTNCLYVRTEFDFADAPSAVIREIALFAGTTTNPALPPGQQYFVPGDITSPGRLVHLENVTPIYRSPAIRETFEVVIVF